MIIRAIIIFLGLILVSAGNSLAQGTSVQDKYQVMAGITYNVLAFMDLKSLPPKNGTDYRLCVAGNVEMEAGLRKFQNKSISGYAFSIHGLIDDSEDLLSCDFVFIDKDKTRAISAEDLLSRRIISISDGERFHENSGSVQIFEKGKYLRFYINQSVLARIGVDPGSKLLRLSERPSP